MEKKEPVTAEVETPPAEKTITLNEKGIAAVLGLRGTMLDILRMLRQGDPVRGVVAEALLVYQVNAPSELCP